MVLSLEETKLYLRVDGDEEDTLITKLILSAEDLCEGILRFPLSEFEKVPEPVKQAILYVVANMYENREDIKIKEVIEVMTSLVFAYRKEDW